MASLVFEGLLMTFDPPFEGRSARYRHGREMVAVVVVGVVWMVASGGRLICIVAAAIAD